MVTSRANLTPRDLEILETLALRVRVLSVGQIAGAWFGNTANAHSNAKRRLRHLEGLGLLKLSAMSARPPLKLREPLLRWALDDPEPNFSRLAWMLASRWNQPAVRTRVVIASRMGGTWAGGHGGRWPRRSEVSHDLTLGEVYLMLARGDPGIRQRWISEAMLRGQGFGDHTRLPDAVIERAGGKVAFELGGEYGAAKLRAFHEFCVGERLPYELW